MKIIDTRSGEVMTPGKIVVYGDGEKLRVIDVDQGLFSARALIETTYRTTVGRRVDPATKVRFASASRS